jgi:ketosteroid isomerase-like protein
MMERTSLTPGDNKGIRLMMVDDNETRQAEAELRELNAKLTAAAAAKDAKAVMQFYAPEIFAFDVGPPWRWVGADAWRRNWEETAKKFSGPTELEVIEPVLHVHGAIAYGHCIKRVTGLDPNGKNFDVSCRISYVYRKIGSEWLVVHEHCSVPVDLRAGKYETVFSKD